MRFFDQFKAVAPAASKYLPALALGLTAYVQARAGDYTGAAQSAFGALAVLGLHVNRPAS